MAIARSNQVMESMPFKAPRKDLKDFRAFLGPPSERYNDAQLEQLQREMDTLAELLLELPCPKERQQPRKERQHSLTLND